MVGWPWAASRSWEEGKPLNEFGRSVCRKGIKGDHDGRAKEYQRMLDEYWGVRRTKDEILLTGGSLDGSRCNSGRSAKKCETFRFHSLRQIQSKDNLFHHHRPLD